MPRPVLYKSGRHCCNARVRIRIDGMNIAKTGRKVQSHHLALDHNMTEGTLASTERDRTCI